jgi:hypothetical protein
MLARFYIARSYVQRNPLLITLNLNVLNSGLTILDSSTVSHKISHIKSHYSPITNPLKLNDLYRRRAVSLLKIKIPSKSMREKPKNTPNIHSVDYLCMVAHTCFGITLPSSGSVSSAF